MARFEKKKTPEEIAAAAQAQADKNQAIAEEQLQSGITEEMREIAEKDEQYRKALNERGDLTLIPVKKAKNNPTVQQVSDTVYPGNMVICERL